MSEAPILLSELAERYATLKLIGKADSSAMKYTIAVNHFSTFVKHPATTADLGEAAVLNWAHWLINTQKLSIDTASMYHAKILSLWRFTCRQGILTVWPEQEKLKVPSRVPVAWSREQLAVLWAACEHQDGEIGEIPANIWWHSLHAVLWDTGERINAVLSVTWGNVNLETGWLVIRAEDRKGKTEDKTWKLHPNTIAILRQMQTPVRSHVWPWPWDPCSLYPKYRQILESAGLPSDRKRMFHCLRKSVASYFEAAGGDATTLLGHSSRAVTKAYLDPQIVGPKQASGLLFRPTSDPTYAAASAAMAVTIPKGVLPSRPMSVAWLLDLHKRAGDSISRSLLMRRRANKRPETLSREGTVGMIVIDVNTLPKKVRKFLLKHHPGMIDQSATVAGVVTPPRRAAPVANLANCGVREREPLHAVAGDAFDVFEWL